MSVRDVRPGDVIADSDTGRMGIYTGEQKTSAPPRYCVTWADGMGGDIPEQRVLIPKPQAAAWFIREYGAADLDGPNEGGSHE